MPILDWTRNGLAGLATVRGVLRSGPFKIAFAFALAVVTMTSGVFAFVYWQVSTADIAQVRAVLRDEAARAARFPTTEMRGQLDLRLTHDLRRLDYVGLFEPDGTMSYGNVPGVIPVPVDGAPHLATLAGEAETPAIFVARRRSDGGVLLLGRSLTEIHRLQATMRDAFFVAILPTALLALITGIIVSRRASRRLSTIQTAIGRVMRGELATRLPRRRATDDINELVGAVNAMLDEIVRLLGQIRSVGENIAHDLKTPLAVMRARLERGLDQPSPDVLRTATRAAMGDLDKAMTTVMALLRISEIESGLRRSAFKETDLMDILRDVHELFEPLAEAKTIAMTLEGPPTCLVLGDGDLLREAIANLVDNALKFTPDGGTVALRCRETDALIRVIDSGPGIAPDERAAIFKRFHRSPATKHLPGAGLGLSMAATIFELHGYTLQVGETPPVGAVFEVIAPGHGLIAE